MSDKIKTNKKIQSQDRLNTNKHVIQIKQEVKQQFPRQYLQIKQQMEEEVNSQQNQSKKKHDNGLAVLTKKFINLIKKSKDCCLNLNQAAIMLGVQKRRIYYITNVLSGISYIQKIQKNVIRWVGNSKIEKQMLQLKLELDRITIQENKVDNNFKMLNQKFTKQFLSSTPNKQYNYVTQSDCIQLATALDLDNQSLILLPASAGTIIESNSNGQNNEYPFQLSLSSTQSPINMYTFPKVGGKIIMKKELQQ